MGTKVEIMEGGRADEYVVFNRWNRADYSFDPNKKVFELEKGATLKLQLVGHAKGNEIRDKVGDDEKDRKGPRATVRLQGGDIIDVFKGHPRVFKKDLLRVTYTKD